MINNHDGEKCSPKELANEILCRCLENIEDYCNENPDIFAKVTERERLAINDQLVKQAKRCYRLLGVHEDDIGEIFDPDDERPQPNAVDYQNGEDVTDAEGRRLDAEVNAL